MKCPHSRQSNTGLRSRRIWGARRAAHLLAVDPVQVLLPHPDGVGDVGPPLTAGGVGGSPVEQFCGSPAACGEDSDESRLAHTVIVVERSDEKKGKVLAR